MSGRASGSARVLPGGAWFSLWQYARVDFRGGAFPRSRENYCGLRLVRRVS